MFYHYLILNYFTLLLQTRQDYDNKKVKKLKVSHTLNIEKHEKAEKKSKSIQWNLD